MSIRRTALVLGAALLGLVAGCTQPSPIDAARIGPFYHPVNFSGVPKLPYGVRRVVILPAAAGNLMPPETKDSLDPIFTTALERQQRFEVVSVSRDELAKSFGFQEVASTEALPTDFLQQLGDKYGAQAVLFVDITSYFAYGPMRLGVRCKLAEVKSHALLWTFDEVYNTSNPAIANALRQFNLHNGRGNLPFDMSGDALSSPGVFSDYVADTTFRTLPPP